MDLNRLDGSFDDFGKGFDELAVLFGFCVGFGRIDIFVLFKETHDIGVTNVGHRTIVDCSILSL